MIKERQYIRRVLITLGLLALFVVLALLLHSAVEVLLLIFAGILFAIFVRGVSNFLFRRFFKLPENLALIGTIVLLVAAVAGFIIVLAPQLSEQSEKLLEQLPAALDNINQKNQYLGWLQNLVQHNSSAPLAAAGKMTGRFLGFFATTLGVISSVFIVLFVGLYLCFTPGYYLEGILHLIPPSRRDRGREVFKALNHTLGRWLIGRFVGMLAVCLMSFVGLLFLDVPLSLGLAVLAGVLTFIPYLGPIIAAVPALLLSSMQSSTSALYVMILYLLVQTVESYLITPLIQQKEVSLPPVLTLASQVVLGNIFGFLGMLLASPLTAGTLVLVKMLYIEDILDEDTGADGS